MAPKGKARKLEVDPTARGYEVEHLGYDLYTMIHINFMAKKEAPSPLLVMDPSSSAAALPQQGQLFDLPQLTEVMESWSMSEAMNICAKAREEALRLSSGRGVKLDVGLNSFYVADYMRTKSKVNGELLHQEVRLKVSKIYASGTEVGELEIEMMRTSGASIPDDVKRMVRGPFGVLAQIFDEVSIIPEPFTPEWEAGILPMSQQPPMEQP